MILAAGIPAVLAQSFSRSFYRNAINNGLIPVECDTSGMNEGDQVVVDLPSLPDIMREILECGGLVPYIRRHGRFHV